jgi:hypothetical protein
MSALSGKTVLKNEILEAADAETTDLQNGKFPMNVLI